MRDFYFNEYWLTICGTRTDLTFAGTYLCLGVGDERNTGVKVYCDGHENVYILPVSKMI